jgi:hypothetical protein
MKTNILSIKKSKHCRKEYNKSKQRFQHLWIRRSNKLLKCQNYNNSIDLQVQAHWRLGKLIHNLEPLNGDGCKKKNYKGVVLRMS